MADKVIVLQGTYVREPGGMHNVKSTIPLRMNVANTIMMIQIHVLVIAVLVGSPIAIQKIKMVLVPTVSVYVSKLVSIITFLPHFVHSLTTFLFLLFRP